VQLKGIRLYAALTRSDKKLANGRLSATGSNRTPCACPWNETLDALFSSCRGGTNPRSSHVKAIAVLALFALLAGGTLAAAQSPPTAPSGSKSNAKVTAETHCRNSNGQVQLRDTKSGAGSAVSAAPGSGATQTGTAAPASPSGGEAKSSPSEIPKC
jgi:hypothetical protein